MFDIYSRVAELIEEKKEGISIEKLFSSPEYAAFIRRKAENIISGTFYSLRELGFKVTEAEENQTIRTLKTNVFYNPKDSTTAFAASVGAGHLIGINAGCDLVTEQKTREEKHLSVQGLLYHELGHVLFTDFPTRTAWSNQMKAGKWFPAEPMRINDVNGINLSAKMNDKKFLEILVHCAEEIENCIEDGFIEREMKELFPGNCSWCIDVMNDVLISQTKDMPTAESDAKSKPFLILMSQILLYALYGECKIGDYDGSLLEPLYSAIEIVDEYRRCRDPKKRICATNELLCVLFPYLDKAIADEKKQQQIQGQGNPAAGGDGGIPQSVSDAIKNAISDVANQAGASPKNSSCTSSALNNPSSPRNNGAQAQQADTGSQSGGSGANDQDGPGGSFGRSMHDVAQNDIAMVINAMATRSATIQAEKERTENLNRDARNIDGSDFGIGDYSVKVERAAEVPASNIASYNDVADKIQSLSRDLQRDIRRVLKDRREGGKLKNLPFGRRFEVSSVVHDDGKYFSRRKLPTEKPRLGVGLLVDESGSTRGELIKAAMVASAVVEDFCRELEIPHLIYGFSTYGNGPLIISYSEPHEIDGGNRYRITGMTDRDGTPTAEALAYIAKQMRGLQVDISLLIVVTDGQSKSTIRTKEVVRSLLKQKMILVAAGIGKNRTQVEKEFGERFIDISNVDLLADQLIAIIKENLWV